MKSTILFLLLIANLISYSQPATIQDINKAINTFSNTLDSTIVKSINTKGTNSIVIDTLKINGTEGVFSLFIKASVNGIVASGNKIVTVKKNGNSVVVVRDFSVMPFGGDQQLNNASWQVQNQNGMVLVKVFGIFNTTIIWTISKQVVL